MPSKRNNHEERVARVDRLVEECRVKAKRDTARFDMRKPSPHSPQRGGVGNVGFFSPSPASPLVSETALTGVMKKQES